MALIEQTEAIKFLNPHLGAIRNIVSGGWDDYINGYSDAHRTIHTSTTRASIVHDHIVERVSRYVLTEEGLRLRLHEVRGLRALVVDSQFVIRFKKFDELGMSRNQPTKQVQDFRSQIALTGIDAIHHLEVGYVLDAIQSTITKVCMTCPNGDRNYWELELPSNGSVVTSVQDLFVASETDEISEARAIIVPKSGGAVVPMRRKKDED